jgi:hypothetical protein
VGRDNAELSARVARLEGVIRNISRQSSNDARLFADDALRAVPGDPIAAQSAVGTVAGASVPQGQTGPDGGVDIDNIEKMVQNLLKTFEDSRPVDKQKAKVGKLVFEEGTSRHVASSFWAGLYEEVSEYLDVFYCIIPY